MFIITVIGPLSFVIPFSRLFSLILSLSLSPSHLFHLSVSSLPSSFPFSLNPYAVPSLPLPIPLPFPFLASSVSIPIFLSSSPPPLLLSLPPLPFSPLIFLPSSSLFLSPPYRFSCSILLIFHLSLRFFYSIAVPSLFSFLPLFLSCSPSHFPSFSLFPIFYCCSFPPFLFLPLSLPFSSFSLSSHLVYSCLLPSFPLPFPIKFD